MAGDNYDEQCASPVTDHTQITAAAKYGADQDVMFRQIQQHGRMGLSDVTDGDDRPLPPA